MTTRGPWPLLLAALVALPGIPRALAAPPTPTTTPEALPTPATRPTPTAPSTPATPSTPSTRTTPTVPRDVASAAAILPGDCVVDSLATLAACTRASGEHARLNVRADLVCTGDACCPGGRALVRLDGVGPLEIVGNGTRLLRRAGQRRCSLLEIDGARGVRVSDWRLDDDGDVAPCLVAERCPRMLHLRASSDLVLSRVDVAHSKGYAIYVDGVDGFTFADSVLRDSGVLGLYVGHAEHASSRVRVLRSTFRDNQTNALALLGVRGESPADNLVVDNLFERNHRRGQWPVAPRFGTGITGGGQLYVARASGVTIAGNRIRDGRCENCVDQGRLGSGVSGIELGMPGRRSVRNVVVRDNVIADQDGRGIGANAGSPMDEGVVIRDNCLTGNGRGLDVPPDTTLLGNRVEDRDWTR